MRFQKKIPKRPSNMATECLMCQGPATLVCTGCREAVYCSDACMREHWMEEHHIDCDRLSTHENSEATDDDTDTTVDDELELLEDLLYEVRCIRSILECNHPPTFSLWGYCKSLFSRGSI
jgi:hypothetical protein